MPRNGQADLEALATNPTWGRINMSQIACAERRALAPISIVGHFVDRAIHSFKKLCNIKLILSNRCVEHVRPPLDRHGDENVA